MLKLINKILNVLLWVLIPYLLVTLATTNLGIEMGIGVMILCLVAFFLRFKAAFYTLYASRRFQKNHEDGFKWYQKAYDTGKMNPRTALIYAYLLIRDGYIDRAQRLIVSITSQKKESLTPQNIQAAELNLAIIEWKKGDLKEAISIMEKIYDEGYRSTVCYSNLGLYYILDGKLSRAEELCIEALDFNPSDAGIKDNLGTVYYKQGNLSKAKEVYEELFESSQPTFIECYYNYGLVLEALGEPDLAADYYKKARSCPERYLSTVKLGQVDMAISRIEEQI